MSKTILELQGEIIDLQMQINEIQLACPHNQGHYVMMYSYRVGAYNPSRFCNMCHTTLPGITEEEDKEVRSNFYSFQTTSSSECTIQSAEQTGEEN